MVTRTTAETTPALNVLIADDDHLVCERIEALLAAHGLGALSVHSVDDAREAMRAIYFPLVILDRHIGDGDGADLCREYRARQTGKRLRILILSADDSPAGLQAALAAGADDFVSKHAGDEELLRRVLSLYRLVSGPLSLPSPDSFAAPGEASDTSAYEGIFHSDIDQAYQDIVAVTAALCRTSIGLITLADEHGQWFRWKLGSHVHQTSRNDSFCAHVIREPKRIFVVNDTHADSRFAANPFVTGDPHVRFYVGVPLLRADGRAVGALSAIGLEPGTLDAHNTAALQAHARRVVALMDRLRTHRALEEALVAQRAADADLRRNEALLREAFEHSPIGVAIVSLDGRWLKVNQRLCEIVGYSPQELLRTNFQRITHPDDLNLDLSYVRQILDGAISRYEMDKRYIHLRGHPVWIRLSVTLVRDDKNSPLYFVAHVQDIHFSKHANAA